MTALPPVNPSLRQATYHWAELISDADPVKHAVIEMGDGHLEYIPPPESLSDELGFDAPLTIATNRWPGHRWHGHALGRDIQAAHDRHRGE